jgi:tripartite-type tricarboxylate transporter receptor subunit TctC
MFTRRAFAQSIAATAGSLVSFPSLVRGQDSWPTRELHVICPFAPGSGADLMSRFYSRKLQEVSGKSVVVENKVGAAGSIASENVARSRPDGYTIYIIPGMNVFASAPYVFKKLPYDPVNDFEHVGTLAKLPLLLVVSAKSPYHSVADLVKRLEERGEKGSYASVSNTSLFCSELFKSNFGLKTVEVKFKDFPTALNELNADAVSFTYLDAPQALGHLREGRIRALVATTAERTAALPDIPGAKEAGISNMDIPFWWSVHVAKGTPRPILDKLEAWFAEITASADTVKFLSENGMSTFPGNSNALRELLIRDTARWAEYAKIAKLVPQ